MQSKVKKFAFQSIQINWIFHLFTNSIFFCLLFWFCIQSDSKLKLYLLTVKTSKHAVWPYSNSSNLHRTMYNSIDILFVSNRSIDGPLDDAWCLSPLSAIFSVCSCCDFCVLPNQKLMCACIDGIQCTEYIIVCFLGWEIAVCVCVQVRGGSNV